MKCPDISCYGHSLDSILPHRLPTGVASLLFHSYQFMSRGFFRCAVGYTQYRPYFRSRYLRWTDAITKGALDCVRKQGFASVDTKALKHAAGTHLDRWVHPEAGGRAFCMSTSLNTCKCSTQESEGRMHQILPRNSPEAERNPWVMIFGICLKGIL